MNVKVQKANVQHIAEIKAIADANRESIGFLITPKLEQAIARNAVIVALNKSSVVGFVIYRHRKRDKQTTLSEICVHEKWRGNGIGKQLIDTLIQVCKTYKRE